MAYTSDLRVKNIIKDINDDILDELKKVGLEGKLKLRIFDESKEDSWPWEKGGLAFRDPITGDLLGSNDAAWYIQDDVPLVVVEGTFGTERGQFGDGQLNRVSHSLSVALNGFVGVTLTPFKGQSFVKKGKLADIINNINYSNGNLHKGMATLAINYSKNNEGKFLIVDPYDGDRLRDLVINATLKYFGRTNYFDELVEKSIKQTEAYLGNSVYGARSNQTINKLYSRSGKIINGQYRFYTQNLAALTTSSKRDGHGLLGKNLIEIHSTKKDIYSIFVRLGEADLKKLKERKSKEFNYLLNNKRVNVLTFDNLLISDKKLKKNMQDFRLDNLHQNSQKELIKKIQEGFNTGIIKINV